MLTVEVQDIYLLTGLSRQGAPISLTGSHGGDVTSQELIDCYCLPSIVFIEVIIPKSGEESIVPVGFVISNHPT